MSHPERVVARAEVVLWLRWMAGSEYIRACFQVRPGEKTGSRMIGHVANLIENDADIEDMRRQAEGGDPTRGGILGPKVDL